MNTSQILYSAPFRAEDAPEPPTPPPKKHVIAEALMVAKWKMAGMFAFILGTAAVDSVLPAWSPEDWTLKGVLGTAVVVLWRMVNKQQAEMVALREKHENDMRTIVAANTASNDKVCDMSEEQSRFFQEMVKGAVTDRMNGGGQHKP